MKFIATSRMGSDCTTAYNVMDYTSKTVGEFVDEVLDEHPHDWGSISVRGVKRPGALIFGDSCEYKYGKLLTKIDQDIQKYEIKEVKAAGGWSNMDYIVFVK